jgi:hypothetical protein
LISFGDDAPGECRPVQIAFDCMVGINFDVIE